MRTDNSTDELVTVGQAARLLGMSPRGVVLACRRGQLRVAMRVGLKRIRLISIAEITRVRRAAALRAARQAEHREHRWQRRAGAVAARRRRLVTTHLPGADPDRWWLVAEAAQVLGVSVDGGRWLCNSGRLAVAHRLPGGVRLIDRDAVDRLRRDRAVCPPATRPKLAPRHSPTVQNARSVANDERIDQGAA